MVGGARLKQPALDAVIVFRKRLTHLPLSVGIADKRADAIQMHDPRPDQARHVILTAIHNLPKGVCGSCRAVCALTALDLGELRQKLIDGLYKPHRGLRNADSPRFVPFQPFIGIAALMLARRQHGEAALAPYVHAHAGLVGGRHPALRGLKQQLQATAASALRWRANRQAPVAQVDQIL